MSQTITINLPGRHQRRLDNAATEEGLSESALIERLYPTISSFDDFVVSRAHDVTRREPSPIRTCSICLVRSSSIRMSNRRPHRPAASVTNYSNTAPCNIPFTSDSFSRNAREADRKVGYSTEWPPRL